MRSFRVEALEKFVVRTVYVIEAASAQAAEQLCREGNAAYDTQQLKRETKVARDGLSHASSDLIVAWLPYAGPQFIAQFHIRKERRHS